VAECSVLAFPEVLQGENDIEEGVGDAPLALRGPLPWRRAWPVSKASLFRAQRGSRGFGGLAPHEKKWEGEWEGEWWGELFIRTTRKSL
jgi:hypothetical protein